MSRTTKLIDDFLLSNDELGEILSERTGLIVEKRCKAEPSQFHLETGMLGSYSRRIDVGSQRADGLVAVRQIVEFSVPLLGFGTIVAWGIRSRLRTKLSLVAIPLWLPPDPLDAAVLRQLARIILISVSAAYFATLLGQTLTFSAHEFRASVKMQAAVLLVSRLDVLPAMGLLLLVNRLGRVAVIRAATVLGMVFSVLSSLAPNMAALALLQLGAKGATAATAVLVTVLAAEIVARRQRAWAIGALLIGAALGAGLCDVLLPVAGVSLSSWRLLYLVSIPLGIWGAYLSFGLYETNRFRVAAERLAQRADTERRLRLSGSRLAVLSTAAFLVNAFLIPTTQFRNEYLRVERHFSATAIGIFVILTNVPGAVGLAVGGRLAETKGRRIVAGAAILIGGGGLALGFVSSGVALWIWTVIGSTVVTAIVPSLGVYQTEMFSTRSRGIGGGIVTAASRIGSIVGVAFVGFFASSLSVGGSVALLFFGMLVLLPVLFWWFPETRGMSLEDITDQD